MATVRSAVPSCLPKSCENLREAQNQRGRATTLPPCGLQLFCSCAPQGLLENVVWGQVLSPRNCKTQCISLMRLRSARLFGKCSSYCLESCRAARGLLGNVVPC